MFSDGSIHQLPDVDPQETNEWLESLDSVIDVKGKARRALPPRAAHGAGAGERFVRARRWSRPTTSTRSRPEQEPWFPGNEDIERRIRAFVRWNAVAMVDPRQSPLRRSRRTPLHLRVGRIALRGGVQPLLPGQGRRRGSATRSTSRVMPRPASTPRVPRRPAHRGATRPLPPGDLGQGLPSYPHPRRLPTFWEYPTVVDGAGSAQCRVPGPVQPLPLQPQDRRYVERTGVVLRRRRRARRTRGDGRARPRRAASASTT